MTVRIAFIGDTLLGGDARSLLDRHGYTHALAGLAELVADADMVIANHEGPITARSLRAPKLDTERKRYWYRAMPDAAAALREVGIGMVSLANNHVLDFGAAGLADTLDALDAAGIAHCGAGPDAAAAREPRLLTVGGIRLGFLSAMQPYAMYEREHVYATTSAPGSALLRAEEVRADLDLLRAQADLTFVLVHWGRNYRPVTSLQRDLGRMLREAGTDVIIGHHPHVAQPVTVLDGTPLMYSLGNGVFGSRGRFNGRPPYGMVALLDITGRRVESCTLRLLDVDNRRVRYRPAPARDAAAKAFLASLIDPSLPRVEDPAGGVTISLAAEPTATA
jgi:poly-gamma-glutamate synthesis protein (capsule biosynthesis protein)